MLGPDPTGLWNSRHVPRYLSTYLPAYLPEYVPRTSSVDDAAVSVIDGCGVKNAPPCSRASELNKYIQGENPCGYSNRT